MFLCLKKSYQHQQQAMYLLYSMPFISALIGWFTNFIAIKMLFHPQEEKDFILFKLQGVFPKRKTVLAERLGKIVANELFSMDVIKAKLDNPETREQLKGAILYELEDYLVNKFKAGNPMVAMFLNDSMIEQIKEKIGEGLDDVIPRLINNVTGKLEDINIEKIVFEKVNNFSNDRLEKLIMTVISNELKFVEIAGAILGFLIGVIQVGLILAFNQQ